MRSIHGLMLCCILFSVGCNNANTEKTTEKAEKGPLTSKLSQQGTTKMMALVARYYALKNALVSSEAAMTSEQNLQLMNEAKSLVTILTTDTVDRKLLQPYLDTVVMGTQIIEAIQDPTCEKQRLAFSGISSAMYAMLKRADLKNGGVYKQYCPMAFNDKGAFWLSEEEEIRNPYFGKKMLSCGEVQEKF